MNVISSIFKYRCPKCRSTKMFKEPLNIRDPLAMHEACYHCGQRFEPEPGFYYGAMFISYIISAWILLILALIMVFGLGWTLNSVKWIIIGIGLLFFLKTVRLSRSIWIHIVVRFNKDLYDKFQANKDINEPKVVS